MNDIRKIKKVVFAGILMLSCILSGCSGKEEKENIEKTAEDILIAAAEKFDSHQSYEMSFETSGAMISTITNNNNEWELMKMIQQASYITMSAKDGENIYEFTKGKTNQKLDYSLLKRVTKENYESVDFDFKDDNTVRVTRYYKTEKTENSFLNMKQTIDFYLTGEYSSYFTISDEVKDGNTIITIKCNDLQGYMDHRDKLSKEKDPDFDRLLFAGVVKTEKDEIKKIEKIFTINKDGEIIRDEYKYIEDYGSNYISDYQEVISYSNFDNIKFDINNARKIMDGLESGDIKEDSVVEWAQDIK